jgi:hypothetical protein
MFESRVPKKVFGPKRVKVTGCWGKQHEELHNLYPSSNIIGMIRL